MNKAAELAGESLQRIPVIIITGFLGSGKTTLLNRFLKNPELENTAVIVNEFGEIGLDHLFLETPEDETVLLANGCLCCTVLGDLGVTLARLMARRQAGQVPPFERVVVETTGLADPTPIVETLITEKTIREFFRPGGIVTVVDSLHGVEQLENQFEAVRQAAIADCIFMSKRDAAVPEYLDTLKRQLADINPGVLFLTDGGDGIELSNMVNALSSDITSRNFQNAHRCNSEHSHSDRHCHEHAHRHPHQSDVTTFSVTHQDTLSRKGLNVWLHNLASFVGHQLLRVKGIVNVDGNPVAINVVQSLIHDPEELSQWPDEDTRTRLVFITRGLDRKDVDHLIRTLDYRPALDKADKKSIDPAEFARFASMMQPFRSRK